MREIRNLISWGSFAILVWAMPVALVAAPDSTNTMFNQGHRSAMRSNPREVPMPFTGKGAPDTAKPSATPTLTPLPKISEDEDILIEEGAETAVPTPEQKAVPDSSSGVAIEAKSDSVNQVAPPQNVLVAPALSTPDTAKPAAPAEPVVPLVIEKPSSINFAENLKEYRNPKIAMLLSLLVPGLGQAYSKHYARGAIYFGVELAGMATSFAFINRGNKYDKEARAFADVHFSSVKFDSAYTTLRNALINRTNNAKYVDTLLQIQYGGWDSTGPVYRDTLLYLAGRTDEISKKSYYAMLNDANGEKNIYSQGWDDCTPTLLSDTIASKLGNVAAKNNDLVFTKGDTTYKLSTTDTTASEGVPAFLFTRFINNVIVSDKNDVNKFGFSSNYDEFHSIMSKKETKYRLGTYVLYGLLVNHLISAIDAGIMAKSYNSRMLGKGSVLDRIKIMPQLYASAWDVTSGVTLCLRF